VDRAGNAQVFFSQTNNKKPIQKMRTMKSLFNKSLILAAATSVAALTGCATGPDAQTGTVVGGILGAATGGIVGHQSGRGLEGAAIGGGLGAIAGNMFGNAQDTRRHDRHTAYGREPEYVAYPAPQRTVVYHTEPRPYQTTTVVTRRTYETYHDGYWID
jgi:hypothetical protein